MDGATSVIGARVRKVRKRRGLSLQHAADLAGISKSYLSMLENGERSFSRRGLIEDLAYALGCSPIDLAGMPEVAPDRRSLAAASAIPALTVALHDSTLDDAPEVPTRPLAQLVELADTANAAADEVRYEGVAGSRLGDLVGELHVYVARGAGDERRQALETLVTACIVARSLAATMGHGELAVTATRRGWDAARRLERPDLAALMAMGRAISLNRIGARRQAGRILDAALAEAQAAPGPTAQDTSTAEPAGCCTSPARTSPRATGRPARRTRTSRRPVRSRGTPVSGTSCCTTSARRTSLPGSWVSRWRRTAGRRPPSGWLR
ncbi:hypothetical protein BJF78_09300 [Pseudonocardia sp. CNS-139]|nr:hypothetical protein BJF78_09300 [Pseudonocardia sp. CNS-139]